VRRAANGFATEESALIRVYVSSVIEVSADTVWSRIRNFNGLPQWHPMIVDSRIENNEPSDRVGCIRHFHTRDGGMIRERLLALSDYDYTCIYEILESPLGVSNYVATLKLTPVTDGAKCFAEWSAEFDCAQEREHELSETIGQGVFQSGFDALKRGSTR
jgi:Polyketide cyclase / dehydrase and lipid transport